MSEPLLVGEKITLGASGSLLLMGDVDLFGLVATVEAIGDDWVVIRCAGRAYARGFSPRYLGFSMRKLLEG